MKTLLRSCGILALVIVMGTLSGCYGGVSDTGKVLEASTDPFGFASPVYKAVKTGKTRWSDVRGEEVPDYKWERVTSPSSSSSKKTTSSSTSKKTTSTSVSNAGTDPFGFDSPAYDVKIKTDVKRNGTSNNFCVESPAYDVDVDLDVKRTK